MNWRKLHWLFSPLAVAWVMALSVPLGPLPALGPLLDLHSGIWRHSEFQYSHLKLHGLSQPVSVAVDSNRVPHLFAASEADLYFVQGFLMASQRLFQMDMLTRVTAGRLSELVGERTLPMDRFFVKLGTREAARRTLERYMSNPQTKTMLESYTRGVNAFIEQMKDLPPEYKILAVKPEAFTELRTVNMAKMLTFSLNGRSLDLLMTGVLQKIGYDATEDLFPEFLPDLYEEFVLRGTENRGSKRKQRGLPKKFVPPFVSRLVSFPTTLQPFSGNGSNNWAVGPQHSTTGHSILANDTHLGLTLPNIWFEIQLHTPSFNVYGVTLPTVPGIVNGFNPSIAWGPTNGYSDAVDWYELTMNDKHSWDYDWGSEKRSAEIRSETIQVKGGRDEKVEVIQTAAGMILHREGALALAVRWHGLEADNELLAFRKLFSAKNYQECLRSFDTWYGPIQNFLCVDQDNISLIHAGFIPDRKVGEGKFVLRAEPGKSQSVPAEDRPLAINPPAGVLRSANQRFADEIYPHYLGYDYMEPFRARRISQLLKEKQKFSGVDMVAMQRDTLDLQAQMALPKLLNAIDISQLSAAQKTWLERLKIWDFHMRAVDVEPALYKTWWAQVRQQIFADQFPQTEAGFYPKDMRLMWMIDRVTKDANDSDSQWIDDKRTQKKESFGEVATKAFLSAWSDLEKRFGSDPSRWHWHLVNGTQIPHVARLPGFGLSPLAIDGSGETVFANKGRHGPTYKLVVELGAWPKAWLQIPGGNSGDPFSPRYEAEIYDWTKGGMKPVSFFRDLKEAKDKGATIFEFVPNN